MSKQDPVEKFTSDKSDEAALRKAFLALKSEQRLPATIKQRIMRQAEQRLRQHNWRSWWYFSQFALGCAALVLVLSWVNPAKLPTYYQIDTLVSSGAGYAANSRVQWHHLTATADSADSAGQFSTKGSRIVAAQQSVVQQRLTSLQQQQRALLQTGAHSTALQRQVGLLTQHDDVWQIALCDDMQVNMAIELVHELRALMRVAPAKQPQWVELQLAPSGHILAIAALPANMAASQCPTPHLPVVQS